MSFPLAYSTLHWQTPDLERNLVHLREAGWDGWEARQSLDWLGSARRVRRLCDAIGIKVAAICGPNVTLSTSAPVHEINKRRIEFASDLEVPTFMTKGPGRLNQPTTDDDLDRMATVYEDLALYAEPLGVTVTFHPHTGHLVDSADEWKRFMARLHHCHLCLDMSHAVHWGYDPVQAVYDYKDRISYVHLHDYKDSQNVELGEGPICDYLAFLKALQAVSYRRWITVCPGATKRTDDEKMRINRAYLKRIGY
ncbi:sugar phosphate isomerase/epimerase [Candidatus Poribacteria bacterium]|nr:sugar phosphate isomerase/epimerase [Candidatus Poribacteria bacterium]